MNELPQCIPDMTGTTRTALISAGMMEATGKPELKLQRLERALGPIVMTSLVCMEGNTADDEGLINVRSMFKPAKWLITDI